MAPNADTLDDSPYIIERHLYTANQLRKVGKEMGWKNIEETINEFRNQKKIQRSFSFSSVIAESLSRQKLPVAIF